MWAHLWPWRVEEEIPIGHITNGVHIPSWLAWQMQQLYDRHFPADWIDRMGEPEVWQNIHNVDPGELWETHNALKNLLLAFVRRRVSRQCRRRGESDEAVEAARNMLDPNVLTIGFARRFATYKRADSDLLRTSTGCAAMLNDTERPVQFIFAGKAHPADEPGKQFIQTIANLRHDPRFAEPHRVRRGLRHQRLPAPDPGRRRLAEQSAATAGGLRHQRPEGGAQRRPEPVDPRRLVGRSLRRLQRLRDRPRHAATSTMRSPTRRDARILYRVLEDEVIPLYYDRDVDGLPRQWIKRMMNSISSLAWRFSAHRMVMDYARTAYVPAAGGLSCDMDLA